MDEPSSTFKREARKCPSGRAAEVRFDLHPLEHHLDNLSPLSTYLGKPGNPAGAHSFAEYKRRQSQHRSAEIRSLLDGAGSIERAHEIYGYRHFICDSGGSLCEVVNPDDRMMRS